MVTLFVETHGDANHYMLTDNDQPNSWVSVVKFNGEIPTTEQDKLIKQFAAAPELLQTLQNVFNHNLNLKPEYQISKSLMREIEQAIAKAEGRA